MGTCRDCRWWRRVPRTERIWHRSSGDCLKLPHSLDLQIATEEYPDSLGLEPRVVTKPDFGCVLFEAKRKILAERNDA